MKIKDEVGSRIKEKLDSLKTRNGHKKLISDMMFPSKQKELDRTIVNGYADDLDTRIKQLEPLIRSLRSHIDYIGDPDKFVAAYLLIGKSFISLKSIAVLVRIGFSYQIIELVRSSMESLTLMAAFLEDGQEKLIEQWFNGKIIGNGKAREILDLAINKVNQTNGSKSVPMKDAMSDIYSVYSNYTHSGYSALFDFIDVFREDFDFEQCAQFHYSRRSFDLINNLYLNILLGLRNFYIRTKDIENLTKVEELLKGLTSSFASPEEINKEMERYAK